MTVKARIALGVLFTVSLPIAFAAADTKPAAVPSMSAAQIVAKHIAARGGLQAWHTVQAMVWTGKMEAGVGDSAARSQAYVKNSWRKDPKAKRVALQADQSNKEPPKQVQLPFVLDMKRPEKARVEIEFDGATAVQVYDGTNGWKVRPFLNRRSVEPFTDDEKKSQAGKWDLDGPLLDYEAQGTKVALDGVEAVEGHNAYKLKLTTKDGGVQHIWIDAQSFLDVKVEGTPRRMDGRLHTVSVYQRDFRSVQGLLIPFVLETTVDGYADTHKMLIEKVAVNPQLDDTLFAKPTA
jgi:outer membrane lipoprotein-sorting protein